MKGFVHSTESFGTVDGPGLRFVVFLQGCPLRCLYCHNPDTWDKHKGTETTAEEILEQYNKNREFYKRGGITVTGGEPLLQLEFVTELFIKAKKQGIHTCLDTSGIVFNKNSEEQMKKFDELIKYTDLVMLDIKHIDPESHKALTGADNRNVLDFAEYLSENNVPLWVRHVVVKGYTDKKEDLKNLGRYLAHLKNLKALDVLPYHTMGISKYKELGIDYPLDGVEALSTQEAVKAKSYIMEGYRDERPRVKKHP